MTYRDLMAIGRANIQAMVQCSTVVTQGSQVLVREYAHMASRSVATTVAAGKAMAACRSPADVMSLQNRAGQRVVADFMHDRNRIAEMTSDIVRGAVKPYKTAMMAMLCAKAAA
ncbi:MAG: phasin family protein [Alphaproteobacteria bacterium]